MRAPVQFKLLIPRDLYDLLAGAAGLSGRSVSAEIRARLRRSFAMYDNVDEPRPGRPRRNPGHD